MVLENSRSEKITLDNELETLRLYIDMEAMRFKEKVKYKMTIEEAIDPQFVEIPPLLLQPYVENAIWHGLMHREGGGLIQIDITQPEDNLLRVVISDDGIGRKAAEELKSKSATKQKSLGLKMTTDRIELINQRFQNHTQVEIIDLENTEGVALGTKIIVEIPI
jgi:LytS/YehU family sensor histidine kinase